MIGLLVAMALHATTGPVGVILHGYDEHHRRTTVLAERIPGLDVDGRPMLLRADAAAAYADMLEAATKDGVFLRTRSAFRTDGQQWRQHKKSPKLAVAVGLSTHQQGRSVDIENTVDRWGRTGVYRWLRAHAAEYCFIQEVSYESWHWQFRPEVGCKYMQ